MEIIDNVNKCEYVAIGADTGLTNVEMERVARWKEKAERELSSVKFASQASVGTIHRICSKPSNKNLSESQSTDLLDSTMCAATGSASPELSTLMMSQTISGSFMNDAFNGVVMAKAAHDALLSMNPADLYEGVLCSRLFVLHNQYMEFMRRASRPDQSPQAVDLNINRATKLMRLYNETLDALNKHRRKGEQKVTVQHQHVNVLNGGQAVVGTVNTGGGTCSRNGDVVDAD